MIYIPIDDVSGEIHLVDELNIMNAKQIFEFFKDKMNNAQTLEIFHDDVKQIDLTYIQILQTLKVKYEKEDKNLVIYDNDEGLLMRFLDKYGFSNTAYLNIRGKKNG